VAGLPAPHPGLVIRYSYLWKRESDQGEVEGRKHRPCVVVLCVEEFEGELVVTVAPVTHAAPDRPEYAVELSAPTRRRLGLDEERNWVMATEVNSFFWPGPDLAPTARGEFSYGELPAVVFEALVRKILSAGERPQETRRSK
jgi:hypothetical protein